MLGLALLVGAWWSFKNITLDAIPDLSDTQVIVYSRWDRSSDIIEDQITYPIVTSLLGTPPGYGIRLTQLIEAIRAGNNDRGGRVLKFSGREYMVRGRGYVKSTEDIEKIGLTTDAKSGTPILVKNVVSVELGPDIRRGVTDLNGMGDTAGGQQRGWSVERPASSTGEPIQHRMTFVNRWI